MAAVEQLSCGPLATSVQGLGIFSLESWKPGYSCLMTWTRESRRFRIGPDT